MWPLVASAPKKFNVAAFETTHLKWTVLNLDVLRVHVGVGVQQQADDGGVAGQHGPVQRRVLVVLVAQVHRHIEGQQQPGGVNAAEGAETVNPRDSNQERLGRQRTEKSSGANLHRVAVFQ